MYVVMEAHNLVARNYCGGYNRALIKATFARIFYSEKCFSGALLLSERTLW